MKLVKSIFKMVHNIFSLVVRELGSNKNAERVFAIISLYRCNFYVIIYLMTPIVKIISSDTTHDQLNINVINISFESILVKRQYPPNKVTTLYSTLLSMPLY